jgi:opacity protein-like surface antigen
MVSLRRRVYLFLLCIILIMSDAYAEGFYVSHLDREYGDYEPPRYYRPKRKKIYVYRDSPRYYRPRREKVYVYREAPPPPPPQQVYIYNEPAYEPSPPPPPPPPQMSFRPVRQNQQYGYYGSNSWAQNNFMLFKLGGFKTNGFGGNSGITDSIQGFTFGAGLGHVFNNYLNGTVELDIFSTAKGEQFSKDENILRKWSLSSNMITANAAISVFPDQPVDFYVKVGLGFSYNKSGSYQWTSDNTQYSYPGDNSFNFAWRSGVGVKVNMFPDIDTGIEYMYTDRGSFKTQSNRKVSNTETISEPREASFTDHTISMVVSKKIS